MAAYARERFLVETADLTLPIATLPAAISCLHNANKSDGHRIH